MQFRPGERILIAGENTEEKALLFRAIGGLWPWGSGQIKHPARSSIMFMPVRAYIPPGTLREAVAYPHPTDSFDHPAIVNALTWVGLEHLERHLDKVDRWDRELTDDEKQCLAFARVVLQRPNWIVMVNDALDLLGPKRRRHIEAIFEDQLPNVGVVHISNDENATCFFTRTLSLESDASGLQGAPAEAGAAALKRTQQAADLHPLVADTAA